MLFLGRLLKPRKRYATRLISEHACARSLTLDLGVKFHCILPMQCDSVMGLIRYILPLSLNVCRHHLRADNFDSIYRKYVQHFYLQINLLKN